MLVASDPTLPDPSPLWFVAFLASLALFAVVAHAQVAFRFLSPVTLEALVERLGAARTEFLRKSLRAPTAFYFSLHLANIASALLLLLVGFAGRIEFQLAEGRSFRLFPTGQLGNDAALAASLFVMLVLVGYILPSLVSRAAGVERLDFMERTLWALRAVHFCLAPVTRLLAHWNDTEAAAGEDEGGEEELDAFIDVGTREGILEGDEGEWLRNVVEFGDTRVREVMTPRTDMVGVRHEASVAEVLGVMAESRFSRIPVYEGQLDDIVGIISLKDVVGVPAVDQAGVKVTQLMKPVYLVPETKRVSELLRALQSRRLQIALVIDEYGGTAGVATIEDLLEEIVGEIREEHEEGEDIAELSEGGWMVKGSVSLNDVEEAIGGDFEEDDPGSVAGLLLRLFDRVPEVGETLDHRGFRFEVREADHKRVHLVHVMPTGSKSHALPARSGGAN